MKIRIKGNSIRMRVTQGEVSLLVRGETIREETAFSPMDRFSYELVPWHLEVIQAEFTGQTIRVMVPLLRAAAWAKSEDEGMYAEQDTITGGVLSIAVEKDYACLKPRAGEDERDHFPHPSAGSEKC